MSAILYVHEESVAVRLGDIGGTMVAAGEAGGETGDTV